MLSRRSGKTCGVTLTAPADPTRIGYTFAGWLPEVPTKVPMEDLTCVAQWTANPYTITFDSKGGSAVPAIKQDFDTAVTTPANPTKTGYTFAGWLPEVPAKIPAEDITCVAKWTVDQCTVTFDSKGGSAVAPITQAYDTAIAAPAIRPRTGYTFAGWLPAVPAKIPAENLTCEAQWTANPYTITFDSKGGSAVSAITQACDTAVAAPSNPRRRDTCL